MSEDGTGAPQTEADLIGTMLFGTMWRDPLTGDYCTPSGRCYDPDTGRWYQRDPNGLGFHMSTMPYYHGMTPHFSPYLSQRGSTIDGLSPYGFARFNPNIYTDAMGYFSLNEMLGTAASQAYIGAHLIGQIASGYAAAYPVLGGLAGFAAKTAFRFAGGVMAGAGLYGFAVYDEMQAIVMAQPNPAGLLAAEVMAIRNAVTGIARAGGNFVGVVRASWQEQRLIRAAQENQAGLAAGGGTGVARIIEGGNYSASERSAANYLAGQGRNVTLRPPANAPRGQNTSDLVVDGFSWDVYTPISGNPNNVLDGIAKKKDQAVGIVVDLSQTSVTVEQIGDVMARLRGKGITGIREVVFMPK